jgi:hypothetical protein
VEFEVLLSAGADEELHDLVERPAQVDGLDTVVDRKCAGFAAERPEILSPREARASETLDRSPD